MKVTDGRDYVAKVLAFDSTHNGFSVLFVNINIRCNENVNNCRERYVLRDAKHKSVL